MLYIYKYYLNLSMYKKTKGMIIDDFKRFELENVALEEFL